MDLYNGWFHKNGSCGFVLKPAIMREEIAYFSANTRDVIPGVSPQLLHIKVRGHWAWRGEDSMIIMMMVVTRSCDDNVMMIVMVAATLIILLMYDDGKYRK